MKEKLTGEEVVKALEKSYIRGKFNCEAIFNAIKLIYRLEENNYRQKSEIERLTEVRNDFQQEVITLNNEKLELKKQVDELKEQRDVFKNLFESCNNSSITTVEIINAMNSFYREQAEHLAELKIEQAVKDTVMKYHNAIRKRAHYSWLSDFHEFMRILAKIEKEEFGAEVE